MTTLRGFVKKRTGVPLGAPKSLSNMLKNSFGASNFAKFWHYWNPIWGYMLSNYIYTPAKKILPRSLAILITFSVSGALHDLAVLIILQKGSLFLTFLFSIWALAVILTKTFKIHLTTSSFIARAFFNSSILIIGYVISHYLYWDLITN